MFTHRHSLPRIIEQGVAQTLTLDVYDDATEAQQTASAGTLTASVGGVAVLSAVNATLGPPASYALLAATTEASAIEASWLEVWSLTIGGIAYPLQRAGYLVRRAWHPTILDADLIDYHSDLATIRPPSISTFEPYRRKAGDWVQRKLLQTGKRPWLIFDPWQLTEVHAFKALSLIFRDFASSIGDGRYKELAAEYDGKADSAWSAVTFRYDAGHNGTIATSAQEGASSPIVLTAGPVNRQNWGRGRFYPSRGNYGR
jgi:hypothetical protein